MRSNSGVLSLLRLSSMVRKSSSEQRSVVLRLISDRSDTCWPQEKLRSNSGHHSIQQWSSSGRTQTVYRKSDIYRALFGIWWNRSAIGHNGHHFIDSHLISKIETSDDSRHGSQVLKTAVGRDCDVLAVNHNYSYSPLSAVILSVGHNRDSDRFSQLFLITTHLYIDCDRNRNQCLRVVIIHRIQCCPLFWPQIMGTCSPTGLLTISASVVQWPEASGWDKSSSIRSEKLADEWLYWRP